MKIKIEIVIIVYIINSYQFRLEIVFNFKKIIFGF